MVTKTLAYSIQFCNHILNQKEYENNLRMNAGVERDTLEKDDKLILVSLPKKRWLRGDLFTASAYFHGEKTMGTAGLEAWTRQMQTGSTALLSWSGEGDQSFVQNNTVDLLSLDNFVSMTDSFMNSRSIWSLRTRETVWPVAHRKPSSMTQGSIQAFHRSKFQMPSLCQLPSQKHYMQKPFSLHSDTSVWVSFLEDVWTPNLLSCPLLDSSNLVATTL